MNTMSERFTPPTLDELRFHAVKLGLPELEADKFFHYYESKGWMVGKTKMKQWRSAMAGWKLRWEETRGGQFSDPIKPTAAELFVRNQELERVREKMRAIKASYAEHQDWTAEDLTKFRQLKARKDELLKLLDLTL